MKTIVNKLRFALLIGFVALGMTALAQAVPHINKMSITTQMFLNEMEGKLTFEKDLPPTKFTSPGAKPLPRAGRPIVTPDTVDGAVYISATVRITDESDIDRLEQAGVIVQCKFDKGLLTTLIPIDRIEEVASIEGVTRINVASYLRPLTDLARRATNVDDVLTLSQDARNAGLLKKYDGSGVILGIIDDGIDFQHKAFTDVNGNTRIKGAYCYNGSNVTADWTGSGTLPTTDDTSEDHGTHTSSIAGGSSVKVNGTTVTVTDDHSTATYGGMAPGADLYLAGTQLATTYVMNAFQKMNNYATAQGKPLVVSNSWSSAIYARDGYSDMSDVLAQYFGGNKVNRICLFAAGNEAGMGIGGAGGGRYVTGTASQNSPLGTILRTTSWVENMGYTYASGILGVAWTRGTNCTGIAGSIHVINKNTGALSRSYSFNSTTAGSTSTFTLQDLNNMTLYVYYDYVSDNGKRQVLFYAPNSMTRTSNYAIAIEVYPIGGNNTTMDIYGGDYTYLTGNVSTNGHTWHNGTDDLSMSDEPMNPNVISVGSYVTRYDGENGVGDIARSSSYATEGTGPTGVMHPWITAPGEVIISAINHYVSYNNHGTVTVNNTNAPYGEMSGTSMATPAAAGIVALWMEAAQEVGKDMTLNDIKEVMKQTAIQDQWTTGANASHFGNGKIDALAGVEYILASAGGDPRITVSKSTVTFDLEPNDSESQTVTVSGRNLTGDITATLNDPNGVYTINRALNLGSGGDLVITYSPTSQGTHDANITLTSPGAEPVTITINGKAAIKTDVTICEGTSTNQFLPVYGYYYDEAQANQMLYPSTKFTGNGMEGNKITKVTFYPTTYSSYSGINFYSSSSYGNGTGTVTVKLANMPAGTTGYTRTNASLKSANFVTVKTITMPNSAQPNLTEWVFDDLENDFVYEGGDLLIEVTTEVGRYGYTYFAGENQSTYTSMYSYGSTRSGQQFLPKVNFEWEAETAPITAGTVSPNNLTFNDVIIGRSGEETVTITNTGNQPFTPVIDTSNLPAEFTVTGNGQVLPHGTLNLTVTYEPTNEGPHSGSFTITIGDQTYTVTVTGNGVTISNTLHSNTVEVPAFHTGITIGSPYTQHQVDEEDLFRELPANVTNTTTNILVKNDPRIVRYDLYHKPTSSNSWTVVALADHQNNTFVPYSADGPQQQGDAVSVDADATAWMTLRDDVAVDGDLTTYNPVVVGRGVAQTTSNTYGYRKVNTTGLGDLENVSVLVQQSLDNEGGTWMASRAEGEPEELYSVYIPVFNITARLPISIDGVYYEPYMYRVWLACDYAHDFTRDSDPTHPGLIDLGPLPSTFLLDTFNGEDVAAGEIVPTEVVIGTEFPEDSSDPAYNVKPVTAFGAPFNNPGITYYVRFYYKKIIERGSSGYLRAPVEGGEYYIIEYQPSGNDIEIVTGINEMNVNRTVVDVTYVNALGMQSSKPFDGVNIVITRYDDGSATTAKVIK